MEELYIEPEGITVDIGELQIAKARECAALASKLDFFSLLKCKRLTSGVEIILIEVDVERPQAVIHDIRYSERISIEFDPLDKIQPSVYALRKDFPQVPHINLRDIEVPKSLCIYELGYDEIKLTWSSCEFLNRIREWLSLTAVGKLHGVDQPLEPLLFDTGGAIVLPKGFYEDKELIVTRINDKDSKYVLKAERKVSSSARGDAYSIFGITTSIQSHGIINKTPSNIADLHNLLKHAKVNFYQPLFDWLKNNSNRQNENNKLIVILILPKSRMVNGAVDDHEFHAITY